MQCHVFRDKKMYLYGHKKGKNNKRYQSESKIILIVGANKCKVCYYLNGSEIICHS